MVLANCNYQQINYEHILVLLINHHTQEKVNLSVISPQNRSALRSVFELGQPDEELDAEAMEKADHAMHAGQLALMHGFEVPGEWYFHSCITQWSLCMSREVPDRNHGYQLFQSSRPAMTIGRQLFSCVGEGVG